jgi:short-chain Z-isoprenyl diphosphate synthase
VRAVGKVDLLPASLRQSIRAAEAATADYGSMLLTIAVAYGGREEIADAVRGLLCAALERGRTLKEIIVDVTPDAIRRHLYIGEIPDPDLIIRTSGETRLSGFLLWQVPSASSTSATCIGRLFEGSTSCAQYDRFN